MFSVGPGDLTATFTCRNCGSETRLPGEEERNIIRDYRANIAFVDICELYKEKPLKARKKLERLILINKMASNYDTLVKTLKKWNGQYSP